MMAIPTKEKRRSYRERYFEDYLARKIQADNRRGYRMEYEYIGAFQSWHPVSGALREVKRQMGWMELLSVALWLAGTVLAVSLFRVRWANGFGTLALAAWLLELLGMVRFLFAEEYVKRMSWEEINREIRAGCVLRGVLQALSLLSGIVGSLIAGAFTLRDGICVLLLGCGAALAFLIWRRYAALETWTWKNVNGRPGERE